MANVGISTLHVVYCYCIDETGSWVLAVYTSMVIYLGKVATSSTLFESVVGFLTASGVGGGDDSGLW